MATLSDGAWRSPLSRSRDRAAGHGSVEDRGRAVQVHRVRPRPGARPRAGEAAAPRVPRPAGGEEASGFGSATKAEAVKRCKFYVCLFMRARALVLVPRGPVRALARLAAVSLPVFARDARVAAAPTIGERSLREGPGFPAVGAGSLLEHNRAKISLFFFESREGVLSLAQGLKSMNGEFSDKGAKLGGVGRLFRGRQDRAGRARERAGGVSFS